MTDDEARSLILLAEADDRGARNELVARSNEIGDAVDVLLEVGDHEAAALLIGSLARFWQRQGMVDRGRDVTEAALASAGDLAAKPVWARAHLVAGQLAFRQEDQAAAQVATSRALALAVEDGDARVEAAAHMNLARIAFRDGEADRMFEHAHRLVELAGDDALLRADGVHMLGWAEYTAGDLTAAMAHFEDNAATYREQDRPISLAMELANLADLKAEVGEIDSARDYLISAMETPGIAEDAYLSPSLLRSAGVVCGLAGNHLVALDLIAGSESSYRRSGLNPDPGDDLAPRVHLEAMESLPREVAQQAIEAGADRTEGEAFEVALGALRDLELDTAAVRALADSTVAYEVVRTRRAKSVEEAAALRGVAVGSLLKTLVVRRGEGDYLFVLVPADRSIDWGKLRRHLGVRRITLPDAEEAYAVTGYERGTITPFGATTAWPVVVDAAISPSATVSLGGGANGVSVKLAARALIDLLSADVADITTSR